MKITLVMMFLLCGILLVGCKKPEPTVVQVNNKSPEVKVEIQKEAPVAPTKPAPPPLAPSANFLKGYNDGYYGTWLGPVRWISTADYRNGWSAGEYDRVNQLPHKYNP